MITIRKATNDDVPAIAKILRGLGLFAHINNELADQTEQRVGRHFKLADNNSHTVYVAENATGEVIGYTVVHWLPYLILAAPEGYVSDLFVCDSERGRGIGTKLLAAVEQEAKTRDCSRLSLLNIRNRESYRRGFYKKLGWREREEAAVFVLPLT